MGVGVGMAVEERPRRGVRVVSHCISEGEASRRSCGQVSVNGVIGVQGVMWRGEDAVAEAAMSLMRYTLGHLRLSEFQEVQR
jgi:hypothetical protein